VFYLGSKGYQIVLTALLWILVHSVSFIEVGLSSSNAWSRPCCTKKSSIVLCQIIKFIFPSNNGISNLCVPPAIALIPLLGNQCSHQQNFLHPQRIVRTQQILHHKKNNNKHKNLTWFDISCLKSIYLSQKWLQDCNSS